MNNEFFLTEFNKLYDRVTYLEITVGNLLTKISDLEHQIKSLQPDTQEVKLKIALEDKYVPEITRVVEHFYDDYPERFIRGI